MDNIIGVDNNIFVADAKDVIFRSSGNNNKAPMFCVMRIGRKYFTLESVEALEYHMERKGAIENVDSTKSYENRILIGDSNIYNNLDLFIKDCNIRKDSSICRDGILTCSPEFFKGLGKADFEKWLVLNVEWLEKTFGDNCIYAVLHMDESTPHLHFVTSMTYTNEKGTRLMSDRHYFGSKHQMSELQSNYALHMQSTFKGLSRGLKGSTANHVSIKQYYKLCAEKLDEKNIESIMAKAKNNELTEIKLKETKRTLTAYKNYQVTTDAEKENYKQQNIKLYQNLKSMQKENEMYLKGIETLAEYYKIPVKNIEKVLEYCKEKSINKELEK